MTGWSSRSRCRAALLHVRGGACTPSARPPRCASTGAARRCSATRSCTARFPAGRRSTCACRRRSSPTSGYRRARPTSDTSTCPTCSPPRGRPSRTPVIPDGGSVAVLGLGPIGDMACRIAAHQGARVIARRPRARAARARAGPAAPRSSTCASTRRISGDVVRDMTEGRGVDSVVDAVGMEAHGSPVPKLAQTRSDCCPTRSRATHAERRRRPARPPCTRRSTSCGAAAPSR